MLPAKQLSQRTLVRMMEVYSHAAIANSGRVFYEHDFPDWFVSQVTHGFHFCWDDILVSLRNGSFFYPQNDYFASPNMSIFGQHLQKREAIELGESFLRKLAALGTDLQYGESIANSLALDGFSADSKRLTLIPLEGPVSAQAEEDAMTTLVRRSGISNAATIVRHMADASSLYVSRKYHASLNESRNLLESVIDNVSEDTDRSSAHLRGLPGGMKNRIEYLQAVGFLTADEVAAQNSAWGALSAGSHPGVPEREVVRIGLVLALEFGQLLLLKFEDWKKNSFKGFTT